MAHFIKLQNRVINLDALAYADFLEFGRAMLLMMGLTQENQNLPLDQTEAKLLRELLEKECGRTLAVRAGWWHRLQPVVVL